MWIRFVCPAGHRLREPLDAVGRELRCPQCGLRTIVPDRPRRPVQRRAVSLQRRRGARLVPHRRLTARPRSAHVLADDPDLRAATAPPQPSPPQPSAPANHATTNGEPRAAPGRLRRHLALAMQIDRRRRRAARDMAWILTAIVALTSLPALLSVMASRTLPAESAAASAWQPWALLLAGLQVVYVAWMAVAPALPALRVVRTVFLVSAFVYLTAAAAALANAWPPRPLLAFALGGAVAACAAWLCARQIARWPRYGERRYGRISRARISQRAKQLGHPVA